MAGAEGGGRKTSQEAATGIPERNEDSGSQDHGDKRRGVDSGGFS